MFTSAIILIINNYVEITRRPIFNEYKIIGNKLPSYTHIYIKFKVLIFINVLYCLLLVNVILS